MKKEEMTKEELTEVVTKLGVCMAMLSDQMASIEAEIEVIKEYLSIDIIEDRIYN